MANVLFKQGTQDKLDQIRTARSAAEGTFYLTSDSHRMYLGIANGDAVPVNEGVTTVATLDDLPKNYTKLHAGQFYYVTHDNILCVFNGQSWVQINPNTNTYIKELKIDIAQVDGVADTVSLNISVVDNEGQSYGKTFNIKGAQGTQVTKNAAGDVVITGDKYTVSADYSNTTHVASLKLDSTNTTNDSKIDIKEGANIHFSKNADGSLTLAADNARVDTVTSGNGSNKNDSSANKLGFYVEVSDTEGNTGSTHIDPVITVGSTGTFISEVHLVNGKAALPVYSIEEIDKKFVGLDAMSYKGTVGEGGSIALLNTGTLQNGDTYLCAGAWSQNINGTSYKAKKGDMLICRGTEAGANGYITLATLIVDVVPSGDDALADTTYVVVPTDNGFRITDMSGSNVGGMTIAGDSFISISDSKDTTNGVNTVSIKHNKVTSAATSTMTSAGDNVLQQYGSPITVPVIEKIQRDAAGHVTDVKVRNYQLKDTNGHLVSEATYTTTVSSGKVIISSAVKMETSDGTAAGTAAGAFSIESKSLSISATGAAVTLELEWGTF